MLAYVFWHRPRADVPAQDYEEALLSFHEALRAEEVAGFTGSAPFRLPEPVPWLSDKPGYADWYHVDDAAALDALNEAAVTAGRKMPHDAVAAMMEEGWGGLYDAMDAPPDEVARDDHQVLWLSRPRGIDYRPVLRDFLAALDAPAAAWRRRMVLGPAPEFAVVTATSVGAVAPPGWQVRALRREPL